MDSKLGFIISGPVNPPSRTNVCMCNATSTRKSTCNFVGNVNETMPGHLQATLESFHNLENLGILPNENEIVYHNFKNTVSYDATELRYTVDLPIRFNVWETLPHNKPTALKRLDKLLSNINKHIILNQCFIYTCAVTPQCISITLLYYIIILLLYYYYIIVVCSYEKCEVNGESVYHVCGESMQLDHDEILQPLFDSIPKRLDAVIAAEGGSTKY